MFESMSMSNGCGGGAEGVAGREKVGGSGAGSMDMEGDVGPCGPAATAGDCTTFVDADPESMSMGGRGGAAGFEAAVGALRRLRCEGGPTLRAWE